MLRDYTEETTAPQSIEVLKHSKKYSQLLDIYVDSTQKNIKIKKWFKILFFIVTMCSLIFIVMIFYRAILFAFNTIDKYNSLNGITLETILSIVTVIVPAISSLIVAFIKIPEIIAQYLFNTKEDENMNSIIRNIQNYDMTMFAMEQKLNELLINNRDYDTEVEDDNIEDLPQEIVS